MKYHRFFLIPALAATTVLSALSCGGGGGEDDPIINPGGGTETPGGGTTGGSSSAVSTSVYTHRVEVPRLKAGNMFIEHSVEYQGDSVMNYCLEYDTQARHSRWVAFRFDDVTRQKNVSRSEEPFIDDPDIEIKYRIGNGGFGSEYYDLDGKVQKLPRDKFDRGHLVASADRYLSRESNEQTFYMSNMSPQISNFNSPYWSSFESYVQTRGRNASFADTLYVVKGGTIANDQILGHVKRLNGAMVPIPQYYFMALLKYKDKQYSALGFWMEHKDYEVTTSLKNAEMAEKVVSIDELEELTGIDFFHNLPDDVETAVESSVNKSDWGF